MRGVSFRPRIRKLRTTVSARSATALRVAAHRWPGDRDRPARLLVHLIEAGSEVIARQDDRLIDRRRALIDRLAGSMAGIDQPGTIEELHEEWPR